MRAMRYHPDILIPDVETFIALVESGVGAESSTGVVFNPEQRLLDSSAH